MAARSTKDIRVVPLAGRQGSARERFIEKLFVDHQAAIRRFLRMRLMEDQDREDVIQDMFLRLAGMEGIQQRLSEKPDSVRSYLFAMAVNLANDRARRARVRHSARHDTLDEQPNIDDNRSPEEQAAARQELAAMKTVLMKLNLKQRNAFVLNRFKCLSYPQIAAQMGISVSAVEKYISNTLYVLRREMNRE